MGITVSTTIIYKPNNEQNVLSCHISLCDEKEEKVKKGRRRKKNNLFQFIFIWPRTIIIIIQNNFYDFFLFVIAIESLNVLYFNRLLFSFFSAFFFLLWIPPFFPPWSSARTLFSISLFAVLVLSTTMILNETRKRTERGD